MRVAIGGISHETNTFSSIVTDLSRFQQRTLLRGAALIVGSRGVSNALGGIVDAATTRGWELVPLLFASATPSGKVRRGTFEALANDLVAGITAALPQGLDGVLLTLHGAMVAEAIQDADGELLRRVRRVVGPDVPIAVVVDFHANLTPLMVANADTLLGYDTYPHLDTAARGCEAVELLDDLHRGVFTPTHALRQVPLLTPLTSQRTDGPTPLRDLMRLALDLEATTGIVAITLAAGFPYSDIRDAGMAVLVTADGDPVLADATAERIAAACWERRRDFTSELVSIQDALATIPTTSDRPIVLADVADNPGAGGSGDGTAILAALLEARITGAALGVIADGQTVSRALEVGTGRSGRFIIGGKTDALHGTPLTVEGRVRWLGDLSFIHRGPMGTGAQSRLGRAAVLEIGAPAVLVIVTELRTQVLDPELFRAVGIAPEEQRVLVVKSSVHFRAAFAPLAARIIEVDGPGLSSPNLRAFPYRHIRRPIWPLDDADPV